MRRRGAWVAEGRGAPILSTTARPSLEAATQRALEIIHVILVAPADAAAAAPALAQAEPGAPTVTAADLQRGALRAMQGWIQFGVPLT